MDKSKEHKPESEKKRKKKPGRRRRNKKDVILDLRKDKRVGRVDDDNEPTKSDKRVSDEQTVKKRKSETTGQYFRRLERMVAKAKVEANLETRFDVKIPKRKVNYS